MKKVISITIIFITFILVYIIQANFFSWFTIAGIKPNLFIILTVLIGIYIGKIYGGIIGVIFGLLLDIFIGKTLRNKRNYIRNIRSTSVGCSQKIFQKIVD